MRFTEKNEARIEFVEGDAAEYVRERRLENRELANACMDPNVAREHEAARLDRLYRTDRRAYYRERYRGRYYSRWRKLPLATPDGPGPEIECMLTRYKAGKKDAYFLRGAWFQIQRVESACGTVYAFAPIRSAVLVDAHPDESAASGIPILTLTIADGRLVHSTDADAPTPFDDVFDAGTPWREYARALGLDKVKRRPARYGKAPRGTVVRVA